MIDHLIKITTEILNSKYPEASVIFLSGSLVRGEGTPYSDLDLVVIFDELPNPYRESFYFGGFPVEAFVHDPETLNYFLLEVDRPSGCPSLAQMVSEGVEVPQPSELSQLLKQLAVSVLAMGPPELSGEDVCRMRYTITDLVDDIRHPRSKEELVAAGTQLYAALADYYFRANALWSAKGKAIPRVMRRVNPGLCSRYGSSFEELFVHGQPEQVIALAEEILSSNGGFLFEGHKLKASSACRKPLMKAGRSDPDAA